MLGYPDKAIERISGQKIPRHERAVFKMVDTCAAEFAAQTPYFYSTYDEENEAEEFIAAKQDTKPTIIVFGSGPVSYTHLDVYKRQVSDWNDIDTTCRERILGFILGNEDLSNWESFIAEIESMGIQDVLAVRQAAYNRYKAR